MSLTQKDDGGLASGETPNEFPQRTLVAEFPQPTAGVGSSAESRVFRSAAADGDSKAASSEGEGNHATTFDLSRGMVFFGGSEHAQALLVPTTALLDLLERAGEDATKGFASAFSGVLVRRLAHRVGGTSNGLAALGVESAAAELANELGSSGLGLFSLERWGKALVFVLDGGPASSHRAGLEFMRLVLDEVLSATLQREFRLTLLMSTATRSRWLLSSLSSAQRVQGWLASGVGWGDAIVRLHVDREVS